MSRGRRMRPSPAVHTPAVAMKSAFPALGSGPSDKNAGPERDRCRKLLKQEPVVCWRGKSQTFICQRRVRLDHLDRRRSRFRGIDGLRHRVQPLHDRGEGRKRLELVDDEGKGGHRCRERAGRLGDYAEFDLAGDVCGGHDQYRDDLDHPVVAGREEADIPVDGDDCATVGDQLVELAEQSSRLRVLLARQQNRLRVFLHVNKSGAKARLFVQLIVVQFDERPPKQ